MMKIFYWALGIALLITGGYFLLNKDVPEEILVETEQDDGIVDESDLEVIPISHATMVLQIGDVVVYVDPTGGAIAFDNHPSPNIILVTDIHGDHFDIKTLSEVIGSATLIVPQAVFDLLPQELASRAKVLNNGEFLPIEEMKIQAMPMYNLPESVDSRHPKGRGNGYLVAGGEVRIYIAGDTAGIPEMRALEDIDIAFVPMNLPYTMSVEEAADAVLAFKPKVVYPYHYRGQNGLSDINKFKSLVNQGNPNITVTLENWYPN